MRPPDVSSWHAYMFLISAAVISACAAAGSGGGSASMAITTDRNSYQLTRITPGYIAQEAWVQVTIKNRGQSLRFIGVCGYKAGDSLVLGGNERSRIVDADTYEWIDGIGVEWACLEAPDRIIRPGTAIVDSVWLHTARPEEWCPKHSGQRMRIRYGITAEPSLDGRQRSLVPMAAHVSNAFVVRCGA
jgi:hypothetical protein